jgi:hypothetical protein
MVARVLPKWSKFNTITRHWKMYQEFPARTQLFTRQSVTYPTRQEAVAPPPRHVQLWLIDFGYDFYDSVPTTIDLPTSVLVPPDEPTFSIVALQHFSLDATTLLSNARPHRSSPVDSERAERENS